MTFIDDDVVHVVMHSERCEWVSSVGPIYSGWALVCDGQSVHEGDVYHIAHRPVTCIACAGGV